MEAGSEEWVVVSTYEQPVYAEIAKSFLQSNGLEAQVFDSHVVSLNLLYSNLVGQVKLAVRTSDLARAQALLAQVGSGLVSRTEGELSGVACPHCASNRSEIQIPSLSRGLRLLLLVLTMLPIPLPHNDHWTCSDCGHKWKVARNDSPLYRWLQGLVFLAILSLLVFFWLTALR